jgi:hypothetical protein
MIPPLQIVAKLALLIGVACLADSAMIRPSIESSTEGTLTLSVATGKEVLLQYFEEATGNLVGNPSPIITQAAMEAAMEDLQLRLQVVEANTLTEEVARTIFISKEEAETQFAASTSVENLKTQLTTVLDDIADLSKLVGDDSISICKSLAAPDGGGSPEHVISLSS